MLPEYLDCTLLSYITMIAVAVIIILLFLVSESVDDGRIKNNDLTECSDGPIFVTLIFTKPILVNPLYCLLCFFLFSE